MCKNDLAGSSSSKFSFKTMVLKYIDFFWCPCDFAWLDTSLHVCSSHMIVTIGIGIFFLERDLWDILCVPPHEPC